MAEVPFSIEEFGQWSREPETFLEDSHRVSSQSACDKYVAPIPVADDLRPSPYKDDRVGVVTGVEVVSKVVHPLYFFCILQGK